MAYTYDYSVRNSRKLSQAQRQPSLVWESRHKDPGLELLYVPSPPLVGEVPNSVLRWGVDGFLNLVWLVSPIN